MSHLLVTGGAGYIGSHTLRGLQRAGHSAVVIDDLRAGNAMLVHDAELIRWRRLANGPLASRCWTIAPATRSDSPETRRKSEGEALLSSTPTRLTVLSTAVSSSAARAFWSTSCWY